MANYLSIDDFLLGIQGEECDVELAGLGVVRVRSLEAVEVQQISTTAAGDNMQMSMLAILSAMVQPKLDADALAALQKAKPGPIATLAQKIMAISGMGVDFEKKVGNGS